MTDDARRSSVSKRSGEVSALGLRVLEILEQHTRFPWPLLKAQCQQRHIDPAELHGAHVRAMLDDLVDGVAKLTDDATAATARASLEALLDDASAT